MQNFFEVGQKYFIRTVTYHYVGELAAVNDQFLILEKASWVADSGRFSEMLENSLEALSYSEIEPFKNPVFINVSAVIDATRYDHNLPTTTK